MSYLALRSARLPLSRPFTTSLTRLLPTNPNPTSPSAEGDASHIPRDKQGTDPTTERGGAAGAPTESSTTASGGPHDQSGMPDPEVPSEEAGKFKEGMTSGKSGPARH